MKHLVRVFILLVVIGLPAAAQAQVSGGVRAGVNLANLSGDPEPPVGFDTLTSLVAGAFVTVPVNEIFAFQPEALYSRQGTKISDSGITARTKLDYVQVPLLARVRTGAHSPLAILFGPSLGFRTGASLSAPGIPAEATEGFEDGFRTFDFGIAAGAEIGAGPLVFDARYTWGLTNILKDTFQGEPNSDKAKNRVLSLTAGLRF